MPGVERLSIDELLRVGEQALELGVPVLDLFGVPDRQRRPPTAASPGPRTASFRVRSVR